MRRLTPSVSAVSLRENISFIESLTPNWTLEKEHAPPCSTVLPSTSIKANRVGEDAANIRDTNCVTITNHPSNSIAVLRLIWQDC